MAVEREYVGIEPFFAGGIYLAVSAKADFQHILHAAATIHIIAASMLIYISFFKSDIPFRKHKPLSLALAFLAGLLCGLNSRMMNIGESDQSLRLLQFFHNLGSHLESVIDRIPFHNTVSNGLLKALLCGNKEEIPHEIIEAFRKSGASHILALSGLHLGIIYGLITRITGLLGDTSKAKATRCILNLSICTGYTLATGASASITRALCFIILNETGKIIKRPASLERILRKSLMIQLIIRPESISEVGFQLSYAAMAGIAWIHPILKKAWPEGTENRILRKIWDTTAVSVSCQLTTGPLAYFYFGTFPIYFILTNLLALPVTGVIMTTSIVAVILSALGACPEILISATEKCISCLIFILNTISQM